MGGGSYRQQSDLTLGLNSAAPTRDTVVAEVNVDVKARLGGREDCGGKRDADEELREGLHSVIFRDGVYEREYEMEFRLMVRTCRGGMEPYLIKGKIVMPSYLGPGIESSASKASFLAVNIRGMNRDPRKWCCLELGNHCVNG